VVCTSCNSGIRQSDSNCSRQNISIDFCKVILIQQTRNQRLFLYPWVRIITSNHHEIFSDKVLLYLTDVWLN
ncbi:MAG: hypothetical protein WBZ20_12270, partial [Nitrososphaeraceae archaeon]